MQIVWFASVSGLSAAALPPALAAVEWAGMPGLSFALAHTPAPADDPFLDREAPPDLVLQLYFDELGALEAALQRNSPLGAFADHASGASLTQQAMAVRRFDVPAPGKRHPHDPACTYLVGYEGPAEDFDAWLRHYLDTHARHLTGLPEVREVEVYTRLDWCSGLPWPRSTHMQRNKVVFDSPAALTAALNSPLRARMREDFLRFPPFLGHVSHHAMLTTVAFAR